jgi:hypothetical protein
MGDLPVSSRPRLEQVKRSDSQFPSELSNVFQLPRALMAAERGGIMMLAKIAMRQALQAGKPKPAPAPRKKAVKKYRVIR